MPDALFPAEAPAALGYPFAAFRGMKGYNGVAILSRIPFEVEPDTPDWCARGDCRHLSVRLDAKGGPIELHDFYVPAGGDIPDRAQNVKFGHKLDFVAEATAYFANRRRLDRAVLSATSTSHRSKATCGVTASSSRSSAIRRSRRPA